MQSTNHTCYILKISNKWYAIEKHVTVMSSKAFMKCNVKTKGYPINSSQYNICYSNGKLNINVYVLTIVHGFQYPNLSYRAGISSTLEVVIKALNSEMSLRSSVSWYDVEV